MTAEIFAKVIFTLSAETFEFLLLNKLDFNATVVKIPFKRFLNLFDFYL